MFFCFRPVIDVWQITAELIDLLSTMDTSHIKLYRQPIDGESNIEQLTYLFYGTPANKQS